MNLTPIYLQDESPLFTDGDKGLEVFVIHTGASWKDEDWTTVLRDTDLDEVLEVGRGFTSYEAAETYAKSLVDI